MITTEQLNTQIEECPFHTVQVNHDHEAGDGEAVYLVREGQNIAEIGRQLVEAGSDPKAILSFLFTGRMTSVLRDKESVPADRQQFVIAIEEIDPKRKCRVLLISPIYLVQFV